MKTMKTKTKKQLSHELTLIPITKESERIAKAVAVFLVNNGMNNQVALPTAIGLMGMFQDAYDADDGEIIVEQIVKDAQDWNNWCDKNHSTFKRQIVFDGRRKYKIGKMKTFLV